MIKKIELDGLYIVREMKFDSKDLMLGIVTLIKFDGTRISKKRWTGS